MNLLNRAVVVSIGLIMMRLLFEVREFRNLEFAVKILLLIMPFSVILLVAAIGSKKIVSKRRKR